MIVVVFTFVVVVLPRGPRQELSVSKCVVEGDGRNKHLNTDQIVLDARADLCPRPTHVHSAFRTHCIVYNNGDDHGLPPATHTIRAVIGGRFNEVTTVPCEEDHHFDTEKLTQWAPLKQFLSGCIIKEYQTVERPHLGHIVDDANVEVAAIQLELALVIHVKVLQEEDRQRREVLYKYILEHTYLASIQKFNPHRPRRHAVVEWEEVRSLLFSFPSQSLDDLCLITK